DTRGGSLAAVPCEVHCPSKNLTITPRQRIVAYREIQRLQLSCEDEARLASLQSSYHYLGDQTCATDGLCATSCPVGIDTGKLIKELRSQQASPLATSIAGFTARNMCITVGAIRVALLILHAAHKAVGTKFMYSTSRFMRRFSGNRLPLWNEHTPCAAHKLPQLPIHHSTRPTVVYFPSCINRAMGISPSSNGQRPLTETILALLDKAGYNVVYPEKVTNICCGMPFASKGFTRAGDRKARELETALVAASRNGEYPVLVDMSPCVYRIKEVFTSNIGIYEPVRFLNEFVMDKLDVKKINETVAIHTTCSARKMGLEGEFMSLASRCTERVVVPETVGCCGWAGDRGFTIPELTESALRDLKSALPPDCRHGYSTSRACEIGLSLHGG
ncbi:MAG: (Fe-S)-binding protein, partial [Bacteroidota bacterium]